MRTRWDCRYSSCEMMYLELGDGEVRLYLDHSPAKGDRHSFDDVLAGKLDAEVTSLFGPGVAEEVKAAVRQKVAQPPPETKEQARLRRRRER